MAQTTTLWTAVEGAIEMTRSSQEELIGMYIADMEQDIADMKKNSPPYRPAGKTSSG